jgi:hypothetical protein
LLLQIKEDGTDIQFSTTCEVTEIERKHLFESGGNFVNEAVLNNQKTLTIINPIANKNKDALQ